MKTINIEIQLPEITTSSNFAQSILAEANKKDNERQKTNLINKEVRSKHREIRRDLCENIIRELEGLPELSLMHKGDVGLIRIGETPVFEVILYSESVFDANGDTRYNGDYIIYSRVPYNSRKDHENNDNLVISILNTYKEEILKAVDTYKKNNCEVWS